MNEILLIYEAIVTIDCDNCTSDKNIILNINRENNNYYIIIYNDKGIYFKQLISDINYNFNTKDEVKIISKYCNNAPIISIIFNERIEYLVFKHIIIQIIYIRFYL